MDLTDNLKKILLAGIGTIASTTEKSKEILKDMVKKGELTMEEAKILDSDLAKNLKEKGRDLKEKSLDIREKLRARIAKRFPDNDFSDFLSSLDEGQLDALKDQIASYEDALQSAESVEEAPAAEADAEPVVEETVEEVEEAAAEEAVEEAEEAAAEEAVEEAEEAAVEETEEAAAEPAVEETEEAEEV